MASNLAQCVKLVGQAAKAGAKILFLPEASDYIGTSAQESLSLARPVAHSPFVTGLRAAAAQHSIAVHVGIHVPVADRPASPRSEDADDSTTPSTTKLYNRTIYITPSGAVHAAGSYDKLHLFDYGSLRESASTRAGGRLIPPIQSPVGRLGSLICFDLRFPEPALHLTRGGGGGGGGGSDGDGDGDGGSGVGPAQVLLYPSAFTVPTGRAHWEVLLRARAVETQSYVVAAAQVGAHNVDSSSSSSSSSSASASTSTSSLPEDGEKEKEKEEEKKKPPRVSYGHSMVVDPWGRVILEMKGVRPDWDGKDSKDAVEPGAIGELGVVDIDLEEWERVRERMPLIRRTDIYPEL